jgi:hypothetical protein
MAVLYCGPPGHCAELEMRLIATHKPDARCQNRNPGGEGRAPVGVPSFVYVSVADVGPELIALEGKAALSIKASERPHDLKSRSSICRAEALAMQASGSS